jgi:hypothetical protein
MTSRAALAVALLMSTAYTGRLEASDLEDEGLVISNNGPAPLLPTPSNRSSTSNWLRFDTDECGLLHRMESDPRTKGSAFSPIRASQFEENDDVGVVPDPSWAFAQQWLYDHPEIAVLSQALVKWCSGGPIVDADPDFYAAWGNDPSWPVQPKTGNSFVRKIDIA